LGEVPKGKGVERVPQAGEVERAGGEVGFRGILNNTNYFPASIKKINPTCDYLKCTSIINN
jgi:hypothetical protein